MSQLLEKVAAKLKPETKSRIRSNVSKFKRQVMPGLMRDNVKRVTHVTMLTGKAKALRKGSKTLPGTHVAERLRGAAVRDRMFRILLNRKYKR